MDNTILCMPVSLEDDLKHLIKRSFLNAVSDMDETEFNYIDNKIVKKIQVAKVHKLAWVRRMNSPWRTCAFPPVRH